jgi:hypothetical protein
MLLDGLLLFAVGVNPPVDQVGDLFHEGELVSAEAVGGLPGVVGVLVQAAEGDGFRGWACCS